ncbi:MAG TPA: DUF5336 domain-containing protein [Pseudonocardiaceae bacterium]|jgi:hypothetical protein|nr:DUF5336 domain-containing protein [Pseudonocardiaceae bacterium]
MSVPPGAPGGYPGQPSQPNPGFGPPPGQPRSPGSTPNPLAGLGLAQQLSLVILVLALVSYFCGFTSDATDLGVEITVLLTGGLLAVLPLLPRAPRTLPIAAVLSVVGGLTTLTAIIQAGSGAAIRVVILVFALLQALVAIGALLLDHEVVKLAPRQAVPYGSPSGFPPPGGFPAPPHSGPQPQHQQPHQPQQQQSPQQQQPTQQQAPRQQPTAFLQHPGQISQGDDTPPNQPPNQ